MQIGVMEVEIKTPGIDKLDKGVEQTRKSTEKLKDGLQGVDDAMKKTKQSTDGLGQSNTRLKQSQDQAASSTANLGRFMREATTSMLGVNVAAIAIGTALGNLATQAMSRLVLAIVQSIDAFATLRNELLDTATIAENAGVAFDAIRQAAVGSHKPIAELTANYKAMASQVDLTVVGIDKFNEAFIDYQRALGNLASPTFANAFGKLFDRLASVFSMPPEIISQIRNINELESKRKTNADERENIEKRIAAMGTAFREKSLFADKKSLDIHLDIEKLRKDEVQYQLQNTRLTEMNNAQLKLGSDVYLPQIRSELDHQIKTGKETRQQQEISNQLRQIELDLRKQGAKMSDDEKKKMAEKLVAAQMSNRTLQIQMDQATMATQALGGVVTNLGSMFTGNFAAMKDGVTGLANETTNVLLPATQEAMKKMEQAMRDNFMTEEQIHMMKRQLAKQEQDQILHTASLASQAITSLFPKSKAAAIAAAIINTAVGVTKALSSAPPPLNFINAALVAAAGAGQIMAIRNTSATGGGSVPSPGSPPVQTQVPEEGPSGRTVTLQLKEGMLFSSAQMKEVIEQLNAEVQNGATLIATETV